MKAAAILLLVLATACMPAPIHLLELTPELAGELVIYSLPDYLPPAVIETFTNQTGVTVRYLPYETMQDAYRTIQDGKPYDLVLLPAELVSQAIQGGYLTELDYTQLPNTRNISPNFRDLTYDPGNHYAIPFHWGVMGLLVRTDLVQSPVTGWQDLWDPANEGRVALWYAQRETIAMTLLSLGFPANSTDSGHLEAVFQRIQALKDSAVFVSQQEPSLLPQMMDGQVALASGLAYDAVYAAKQGLPVEFILPEDGPLLWSDFLVIPLSAPNKQAAHAFLNFIYEPVISAELINQGYYAMPTDAVSDLIDPALAGNPAVFPPVHKLRNAEMLQPLGPDEQRRYDELWQRLEISQP